MKNLLTLCFLSFSFVVMAHTIRGSLVDAEIFEPIPAASIALFENGKFVTDTETNKEGQFQFTNLPSGNYAVEAHFVGYNPIRTTGIILEANKPITLDFVQEDNLIISPKKVKKGQRLKRLFKKKKRKHEIRCFYGLVGKMSFTQYHFNKFSLSGKVTDSETGEPILFGSVAVYQGKKLITGGETDLDGNYEIKGLSAGTYRIKSTYVGYESTTVRKVKVHGDYELDIEMDTDMTPWIGNVFCCSPLIVYKAPPSLKPQLLPQQKSKKEEKQRFIYPNPAVEKIHLKLGNKAIRKIEIYNVSGSLVSSQIIDNQEFVKDVNRFAEGLYYLKIVEGNKTETLEFLVVK